MRDTWISFVAGIVVGVLLIETALVLLVIGCRKRQVRKENVLKEHIYYTIGQGQQARRNEEGNPPTSSVTLTNYVNLPQTETQPIDIPLSLPAATTTNKTKQRSSAEDITNSAYSAGIHYACIPGEPTDDSNAGDTEPKPPSFSDHVYSEIKDKGSAKKKSSSANATVDKEVEGKEREELEQEEGQGQQRGGRKATYENEAIGHRKATITTLMVPMNNNKPVEMASEGFIELKPRNLETYDTLKRNEDQANIEEISILATSGKLLSTDEFLLDSTPSQFSPYGRLSDDYTVDNELLPDIETEFNPYDDIIGVTSYHPSLQPSANASASVSHDNLVASHGKLGEPTSHDNEESEMAHAYDVIDELQKQIHILSQSIPTLDLYGYEDLDKIKPVPKTSQSIPALDVAGYEDLDAVKPGKEAPKRPLTKTLDVSFGVDGHLYEDIPAGRRRERHSLAAVIDTDELPPSVPPHTIESQYTAVQKKKRSSTVTRDVASEKEMYFSERHMTAGGIPKKSSSTNNLLGDPPPVPPVTAGVFYTAVQKPKKKITASTSFGEGPPQLPPKYTTPQKIPPGVAYTSVQHKKKNSGEGGPLIPNIDLNPLIFSPNVVYSTVQQKNNSATKGIDQGPPPIPPKSDIENPPIVPPKTVECMYTAVQKRKKAGDTEAVNLERDAPPPIPPKTAEKQYLAAEEANIPPIPPRAVERLYSGVYRHKEQKETLL